jgi:hypothetical protein
MPTSSPTTLLSTLCRIALDHGHLAVVDGSHVNVGIACVHRSGEESTEWSAVRSVSELRAVLGY